MNKPEDVAQMHHKSPIILVDKIQAADLIVAGKRDRIVGFEQTEIFIAKAKALGKNIDKLIFDT